VNAVPLPSVVLLDDEKTYLALMAQMLEEHLECSVTTFTRPLDALGALPSASPAVIVSDYFMPQINGLEFIRLASAIAPDAAFLLISAHDLQDAEPQMARLANLKGFLPKPFGWRRLAEEIKRVWPAHSPAPQWRAVAMA
jgi:CheY-like chemotaxis protein